MGDSTSDNALDRADRSPTKKTSADRPHALLGAVVAVLTGAILGAVLVTWLLWGIVSGAWVWPWGPYPPSKSPDFLVVLKVGLTVVAGAGGGVALVVAYRKQALAERQELMARRQEARAGREEEATQVLRFVERFGAAASQLGDRAAAVRLAGVYAMASLADEYADHRQQCIDVLSAYLRLPYSPDPNDTLLTQHLSEKTTTVPGTSTREQRTYHALPNDQQVRTTIVSVIRAHLHPSAPVSWSHNNFDFSGAAFLNAQFDDATFSGEETCFNDASFSGEWTSFSGASFSGAQTSFDGATFSGRITSFVGATFSEEWTSFSGATFSGKNTLFGGATFSGAQTWFDGTRFSGEETSFRGTTFSGAQTRFDEATFSGTITSFDEATFSGGMTQLDEIQVAKGSRISIEDPHMLDGARITRDGKDFRGWPEPSS